jgi:hypothetical protein
METSGKRESETSVPKNHPLSGFGERVISSYCSAGLIGGQVCPLAALQRFID